MSINQIFSSMVFADFIDVDLKSECLNERTLNEGRIISNRGGWQSNDIMLNENFRPLFSNLSNHLSIFYDLFRVSPNYRMSINEAWININSTNDYNVLHNHGGSFLSGVFYVDVGDNAGNLWLKHPSVLYDSLTPDDAFYEFNELNSKKWVIAPQNKKIIIFPGWVEHAVEQNLSGKERISIAFNINLEKVA